MIHPHTELKWISDVVGRGVFVTRFIPKGTIVWTLCHLDIVLNPGEVSSLGPAYKSILDTYAYFDQKGDSVLCWDLGRFVNHSCDPAMLAVDHCNEIAARDLHPGDELTCDYRLLNYPETLTCRCGRPTCRGSVRPIDVLQIDDSFSLAVASSLECARDVEQPLRAFMRNPVDWDLHLNGQKRPLSARDYYYDPQAKPVSPMTQAA